MASKDWVKVKGSEHTALPGAQEAGAADQAERIEVTVLLRPNQEAATAPASAERRWNELNRATYRITA
jgi:hypothetical protein